MMIDSMPLYKRIAREFWRYENASHMTKLGREIRDNAEEAIKELVGDHLPHGSGFDSGTKFDFDASTPEKLVFYTSFHHMGEHGMYTRWTDHTIIVKPSLSFDIELRITGRNHNDIKDYISECFHHALTKQVEPPSVAGRAA